MLGFIVALKEETKNLRSFFKNPTKISINGFDGFLFNVLNKNVVLIYSGVGKANAAAATIALINNFSVTNIINIGSAGSLSEKILPNTFVVPESIQYIDVDVTGFGYKFNQIPHEPEVFTSSTKLNMVLKEIIKEYQPNFVNCVLGTSDSFVNQKNVKSFNINGVDVADMEACAIAQICNKNNINFTCAKYISDSVFHNDTNETQWKKNVDSSELISELIYNTCYKFIYSYELTK